MYETEKLRKDKKYNSLIFTGISRCIGKRRYGTFQCDCGNTKEIRIDQVLSGTTKSCGCLYKKRKNDVGLSSCAYEKLYNVWSNMIKRCYNENSDRYSTYGERGIAVCEEWKNDFKLFAKWAVENGWKPSLSIERSNVDIGYCPENCTFITMKEQARNKTNNIFIMINGVQKCIAEWCEILGLSDKTIYMRYERGIRDPKRLFYSGDLRCLN